MMTSGNILFGMCFYHFFSAAHHAPTVCRSVHSPTDHFFVWFRFCSMFNILKSSHFPQYMFVSIHFHICRICIYHIFGSGWPPGFLGHGGGREVVGGLWH